MPLRCVCLLYALLFACVRQPAPAALTTFPVATPTAATDDYEREYVGEIHAAQHVELRSRLAGFVEVIAVDEGHAVKKGQLLFTISAREVAHELQRAEATTHSALAEQATAEIELKNLGVLREKKIVADAQVAMAESKLQVLRAQVDAAKATEAQAVTRVSYAKVTAPFDGVINRLPKKVGSVVSEGELLTTLSSTKEVLVYFRVSEQEYLDFVRDGESPDGRTVSLKLANGTLYPHPGHIDAVESEFSRDSGNIAFRARFPNEKSLLKHGGTAKVLVRADLDDFVAVPQKATFEVQEHVYVYVVDDDGFARARRIVPKMRLKDTYVIESGLTAGERFVLEGVQKVKDGDKIHVQQQAKLQKSAL